MKRYILVQYYYINMTTRSERSRPNILFVVLDTARQMTVSELIESGRIPNITEIAKSGRQFATAISQSPWTLPSHASLFTGQYTENHNTHAGSKQFDPDVLSLPEQLSSVGYQTAGISGNPWITPEFGFDRGFDQFSTPNSRDWGESPIEAARRKDSTIKQVYVLFKVAVQSPTDAPGIFKEAYRQKTGRGPDDDHGAKRTTSRSIKWLTDHEGDAEPWFLFLNYIEPHLPYKPPRDWLAENHPEISYERIKNSLMDTWPYVVGDVEMTEEDFEFLEVCYEAEIEYLDCQLGRLFNTLEEQHILDETAVVLIGDHGDNIGERGRMGHQHSLLDPLVNVPLIIRYPPEFEPGIDAELVETRDIYPTLLALADIDFDGMPKTSSRNRLQTLDHTRSTTISQYVTVQPSVDQLEQEYGGSVPDRFDRRLRSARTERWKIIERNDKTLLLFDKESDEPYQDVSETHPDVVARLRDHLTDFTRGFDTEAENTWDISDESRERLANLGYI